MPFGIVELEPSFKTALGVCICVITHFKNRLSDAFATAHKINENMKRAQFMAHLQIHTHTHTHTNILRHTLVACINVNYIYILYVQNATQ